MGTSQSSSGSPSGVPMVPPWVTDQDSGGDAPVPDTPPNDVETDVVPVVDPNTLEQQIAPRARFGSTRRAIGKFAESGNQSRMRQGVGRYVSSGLGGSRIAARRLSGTASAASALYSVISGGSTELPTETFLDRDALEGKSAREIMAAIVEATQPVDGTRDTEASRLSINDALSDLIARHPDVDLLDLTEEHREFVLERFVGMDVYLLFVHDVGQHIMSKAPSATVAVSRLRQVREYIRETIYASFRRLREAGTRLSGARVSVLVRTVLQDAFNVFSEYAE